MAAFKPNIDYVGHQRVRQQGIEGVTRAKLNTKREKEAEERRQAAIRASTKKKSSFGRKALGAVTRGVAAYYTMGASESSGLGGMLDQQIQGGDDYEKNEYGELVGAANALYQGSNAQKAQKLLGADAAFDKQYGRRKDNVNTLREQGQFKDAQLAQESLDNWENTYLQNKDKLSESGFLGTNIGIKDSEYSGLTSGMTNEEMSAKRESLNKERSNSIMQGKKEADRIQRDKDALHYQEQARTRANKSYIKPPSQKQASMSPNQEELITSTNQGYIKPSISPADYKVQPSNYNVMAHRGADAIGPTALNLVEKEKLRLEEEQKEYLKRINEGGR